MITHLQAALAFALTMMALATVVTLVMEIMSRFMHRRNKNLRHMLALVFEGSIKPQIDAAAASPAGTKVSQEAKDFAGRMVQSPFEPRRHALLSKVATAFGADAADSMSGGEFLRRLAHDEIGGELRDKVGVDIDDAVKDISLRFDEVSEAAHDYYTDSSRIVSIMVGIVLALVVNIDGIRIYTDFINNPATAQLVIEQADTYKAAFLEEQQRLDEADPGAGADEESQEALSKAAEEIDALILSAKTQLTDLSSQGIDMGWTYTPHCLLLKGDNSCKKEDEMGLGAGLAWLISAIITGILMGLGGPFWYNVVTGLMRATQIMRGQAPQAERGAGVPADKPKDPPDVFKAHVDIDKETRMGRSLLSRQLRRLRNKIEATGISLPAYSSTENPPVAVPWGNLKPTDEVRKRTEDRYRQYLDTYRKLQAFH